MNSFVKAFLVFILLSQSVFALGDKYYQEKFNVTKKLYIGSIMSNDKNKEIEYLKKLIRYGNKLNIDTLKYKRELNRLDNTAVIKNRTTRSIIKPKVSPIKKIPKKNIYKPKVTSWVNNQKYSIKSVTQTDNSVIINFNKNIDSSYIDFNELKKGNFYYDEFLLKGNFKDAYPTKLSMKGVYKISVYQKKNSILSIMFKNKRNLKTIYIINKKQIIIKVLDLNTKPLAKNRVDVSDRNMLYPGKKVIVIDPGHGGSDPGATYKRKRLEKDVTLKISKYLKKELETFGFKVYLTRTKDKYLKLPYRTKYANSKHADIFISIHANAAHKSRVSKAHGVESYFLSPARSARAKRVAALENKGDMNGMGWSSKDSLLTILNRAKITAANKMAIDIQKNMLFSLRQKYGKKNIRDGGVREGPFWVLVGAQMPSVLVEVGYITHPKEGYRITTTTYQKLIAKGIAKGIESYFIKN